MAIQKQHTEGKISKSKIQQYGNTETTLRVEKSKNQMFINMAIQKQPTEEI